MGLLSTIGAASGRAYGFTRSAIASAVDAYFNLTTLLLPGNGTNGAQNNTFLDSSSNAFSITRNGNTTQGTFTPFSQTGWSNYFNGSSYLQNSTSAPLATTASTFTIEAWVYMTAAPTNGASNRVNVIADANPAGSTMYWGFGVNSSQNISFFWYSSGAFSVTGNTTISLNAWHHIAISVSSNAIAMYVDGIQQTLSGTTTLTNRSGTTFGDVGVGFSLGYWNATALFYGYMSNVRIVSGTAVYSGSSFTPPTTPLTAISGTSVLTCQSNRFLDNSTNSYPFTTGGSPSVQAFSPFAPTAAYSAAIVGGSMYNSATPDGLKFLTSTTQFGISGDFTIELWFYPTAALSAYNPLWILSDSSGAENPSAAFFYNGSYNLFWLNNGAGGNGFDVGAGINIIPFQWNHIAISRSGANIRCWTNGILRISNWGAGSIDSSKRVLYVATNKTSADTASGYISGFRFVNGSAVYSGASNFTPPTAPPTAITNTSLLLNYTNAGIIDSTGKCVGETVGTAQISTTQSKYGGSSIKTDGSTSSWVYIPFNRGLDISTGAPDWTLECWGYVVSFSNSPYLFNKGGVAATYYTNYSFVIPSSGVAYMALGNNGGETGYNFGTVAINTWYHFAATRQGNTIRTFLNGTLVTNTTIGTTMTDNGEGLYIGCLKNLTSQVLNGYVDDLRITKGYARYTTNFTPPTSAFQLQ